MNGIERITARIGSEAAAEAEEIRAAAELEAYMQELGVEKA